MQALYSDYALDPQALDLELLELSPDDIIGNSQESDQFRRRLDCPQILIGICQDYELGFVDAKATIQRLEIGGLLETSDQLCHLICAGVRSLTQGDR